MANVYRSEVILKGEKSEISNFIKNTFSTEDGQQYLDFEKLLPLNGKNALDVWGCDSEVFNFEVTRSEDQCFAFRFDVTGDLPSLVISQIMNIKGGLAEIIIRSCCEQLSIALHMIGNRDLRTMIADRKSRNPLSKKFIKHICKALWGYSKIPNFVDQGFIDVGGGCFMKFHSMTSLEDLYPRFKKAK
ncbi:hypothetical protein [Pseudomonas yamanorum]|uniref:hypothetical protein n=1 Tax=Pseudomonas yamanorum TaxID=515393 RepID=UPI003F7563C7